MATDVGIYDPVYPTDTDYAGDLVTDITIAPLAVLLESNIGGVATATITHTIEVTKGASEWLLAVITPSWGRTYWDFDSRYNVTFQFEVITGNTDVSLTSFRFYQFTPSTSAFNLLSSSNTTPGSLQMTAGTRFTSCSTPGDRSVAAEDALHFYIQFTNAAAHAASSFTVKFQEKIEPRLISKWTYAAVSDLEAEAIVKPVVLPASCIFYEDFTHGENSSAIDSVPPDVKGTAWVTPITDFGDRWPFNSTEENKGYVRIGNPETPP